MNFKAYDKSGAPLYYVKFNTKTNALGVKTAPKGVVVTKSGAPLYYVKFNTKTNALGVKTAPKGVVVTIFGTIWSRGNSASLSGIC